MCATFGCGPTVVSREGGGGGTDTLTAGMNGYMITSMAVAPSRTKNWGRPRIIWMGNIIEWSGLGYFDATRKA